MRPPEPAPPAADAGYVAQLGEIARPFGITHWGVAPADVLTRARRALVERADAGLADTMAFTYRDPIRSTDPRRAVAGARAVLVMARPYPGDLPEEGGSGQADADTPRPFTGRIARYAWSDSTGALRAGLWAVARRLRADRWKAVAYADDNSIVDREVAFLAGLGWFGKNANLLIRGAGSWFVIGCVVTTCPLPVNERLVADGCGPCARCVDACPTGAIVAPGVVDARRCLSWLLQRPGPIEHHDRVAIGTRLYGCDDCQEVCPPTVVLGRRSAVAPADQPSRHALDLLALLAADDETLLTTWGRWYLANREPRWIRRNALVALGNALAERAEGERSDELAVRARLMLNEYVHSDDPILAEHARWAVVRAEERSDCTDGTTP